MLIGTRTPVQGPLPLTAILERCAKLRDAIALTPHVEDDQLHTFVANQSFIYAFNTYKAISLLLPDLYHESAAVVLRQLWEVSLNLHWILRDLANRSQDFCNFTLMEHRKVLQETGDAALLVDFDSLTAEFQSRFSYKDKRGKKRRHSSLATMNVHARSADLGEPWKTEYQLFYHLGSMHAHGAPGAVFHGVFLNMYGDTNIRESNVAGSLALMAADIMVRNVQLLADQGIVVDPDPVEQAFQDLRSIVPTDDRGT